MTGGHWRQLDRYLLPLSPTFRHVWYRVRWSGGLGPLVSWWVRWLLVSKKFRRAFVVLVVLPSFRSRARRSTATYTQQLLFTLLLFPILDRVGELWVCFFKPLNTGRGQCCPPLLLFFFWGSNISRDSALLQQSDGVFLFVFFLFSFLWGLSF